MTDKVKLYVVRNDDGEYLMDPAFAAWFPDWTDDIITADLYEHKEEAEETANKCDSYVVELVEAPDKVVVSEEEAEMLERAKYTTVWRPASVIAKYAYEHERQGDDEALLEDRLMRAYVNGWTVENPKRWNVKVPHAKTLIYYKVEDVDDLGVAQSDSEGPWVEFTAEEIEHYGLGDCQKVVCADSARTTGEVKDDGIC